MVGSSLLNVSTSPSVVSSMLTSPLCVSTNFAPYLPLRLGKKPVQGVVMSTDARHGQSHSSSEKRSPFAIVLDAPRNIWRQTLKPLSDFGFGKKSVREGGFGVFLVVGVVLFVASLAWLRGFQLRSKFRKYLAVFEFDQACGICTGTPVRIRGITVGNVIRVKPSLRSIEAVVELEDDKIVIPRNSLIEVNQSGLLMETLIDITPRDPIPAPTAGPLDAACAKEGLIVCDRQKIKGYQGVSLDALVGIFTRLGREMEHIGVLDGYSLADRVTAVIEEAKPLLTKIKAMTEDVKPLLTEVWDSGLLKEVENLTRSLAQASEDLRKVHTSIMTPESTELIQKSIYSLIFTLKNIENISSDILGFTGDEATRRNLKALIKSLSRML